MAQALFRVTERLIADAEGIFNPGTLCGPTTLDKQQRQQTIGMTEAKVRDGLPVALSAKSAK